MQSTLRSRSLREAALELLPDTLYVPVATGPLESLDERIESVLALRAALVQGTTPGGDELRWPDPPLKTEVLRWLKQSRLPHFCCSTPDLADAVILDILERSSGLPEHEIAALEERFAELVAIEQARRSEVSNADTPTPAGQWDPPDESTMNRLRSEATRSAPESAARKVAAILQEVWAERLRVWCEIDSVFRELGGMCGIGWDLSKGVLQHTGWQEMRKLADLLKELDQIRQIVRTLGRMRTADTDNTESVLERVLGPARRAPEECHVRRVPWVPHETRGVERSNEVARMLASEAALFNHQTLQLLWHVKRAEHTLTTYRVIGTDTESYIRDETGRVVREVGRRHQSLERGPIIVCLDTSGSMKGAPEAVAKAITLEAVRIAHSEGRDCYLYAFSGPEQVVEYELSLSPGGIDVLLEFLSTSFHGGTDLSEPIRRGVGKIGSAEWSRADILLVSDGEFPVPDSVRSMIEAARRDLQLRLHGLLVAAEESEAMSLICEPIHKFSDWDALQDDR
jgi:uncharacterized protein with von Willebrand factor type A (vWA) domain